jgi:oxygen-dependent protoporphyrinogen oxidase
MKRVAIIGGGASGLSAAYYLDQQRRCGAAVEYAVFERAPRLGGVLGSERVDGCLIEAGPDSFLTEKPWALALCRELGLGDQVIGSNDAQRKTFILVRNRLVEMPDGLMFMVPTKIWPTISTPLFSWSTKLRMAKEFFCRPHSCEGDADDESAAALVQRHFGAEVVERLADPLLSGIYGADSDKLSVRAVLPRFEEMERKYGSLIRGMLAAKLRQTAAAGGKPKPPLFSSLKNGMQQLIEALQGRLEPCALRTNLEVTELRPAGGEWEVSTGSARERFDAVVVATPAHAAGRLLTQADPLLAEELGGISYSSSVTISLIYDRHDLAGRDTGFGFLVPRSEHRRLLACSFVHNKFPHRAPGDRGIVRGFLGGFRDADAVHMSDEELLATLRQELQEIAGISARPRLARIYRWERAMAQPSPGHLDRIARIESLVRQLPGLALAGNYFRGIGVPDCVRTGKEAANHVGIAAEAKHDS